MLEIGDDLDKPKEGKELTMAFLAALDAEGGHIDD
jgi:hypothetical protein